MKRRVIGILVAVLLAVVGTLVLVKFVQNAKDKAVKKEAQVTLLVVKDDIPQGATVAEIAKSVEAAQVPTRLKAEGALDQAHFDEIDPLYVAGVALKKGDQLIESRLVDPRTLVHVSAPAGLQEITVSLSPERAVGASLSPGDTVGVIFSFDPFDISSAGAPPNTQPSTATTAPTRTPNMTHLTLHKVLVTSVQFSKQDSQRAAEIKGGSSGSTSKSTDTTISATVVEAPSDQLLITLAVSAPEAEQIAFASEFGHIWLTSENAAASEDGTRILTEAQVYVPVPR